MARIPTSPFGVRKLRRPNEEGSTALFFILPTLLVAAVYVFCALVKSDAEKYMLDDEQEASLQSENE